MNEVVQYCRYLQEDAVVVVVENDQVGKVKSRFAINRDVATLTTMTIGSDLDTLGRQLRAVQVAAERVYEDENVTRIDHGPLEGMVNP